MGAVARPFLFAWHFLTAIPLSRAHHEPTAPELAASMAWYPVVGFLIGGGLVLADRLLTNIFAAGVVNALLIVLLVLLTRGLHQDGLARTPWMDWPEAERRLNGYRSCAIPASAR